MDYKNTLGSTRVLSFNKKLAILSLAASCSAAASELHPIEDTSIIDPGRDVISLKARLLMNDSCVLPKKGIATIDSRSLTINLKQTARDPESFCNQVITERESNFEIEIDDLNSGEYELIDDFGKESLGTLYIGPEGSIDLFKYNENLL